MNREHVDPLKGLEKNEKGDSGSDRDVERDEFVKPTANSAARLIQAGGRDPAVVALEQELTSFFIDSAEALGVPKSVAAIYGICFASVEPLSFANIQERLRISQGSISQGIRVLKEIGALRVVGTHDRREYFTPEIELRRLATRFLEERLEKQLKAGKHRLQAIKAVMPDGDNAPAKVLRARLSYLQAWHEKARGIIPLAKTFLRLT